MGPQLGSIRRAGPMWWWEMPQSDSYYIDFKQSDTLTLKNTNAILLPLTAANHDVGEDP